MKSDRIVMGWITLRTAELLKAPYAPFNRSHDRAIIDICSVELTKYVANAVNYKN